MNEQELRLAALDAAVKAGAQSWDVIDKADEIYRWLRLGRANYSLDGRGLDRRGFSPGR